MIVVCISPRHLERRPHRDPARPSVERVAAGFIQKDCVHPERRCRPKNCADIGGIRDILKDCDPAAPLRDLLNRLHLRPLKAHEQTTRHGDIREISKCLRSPGKDRYIPELSEDLPCLSLRLSSVDKGCDWLDSRSERPLRDLRALRDEESSIRFVIMAELRLVQPRKNVKTGIPVIL